MRGKVKGERLKGPPEVEGKGEWRKVKGPAVGGG
jgi:hypothetical protein